jgi:HAE1 family hydrophobic/amphiphilic exporter-1
VVGAVLILLRGAELFPEDPSDSLRYVVDFPIGIPKQKLNLEVSKIESEIQKIDQISRVFTISGRPTPFQTELLVEFKNITSEKDTLAVEAILRNRPSLEFRRIKKTIVSEAKALRVEFFNDDFQRLSEWTDKISHFIQSNELLSSIEKGQKPESSEISVEFSPSKLNLFGIDHQVFIGPMRAYLKGLDAGVLSLRGQDVNISLTAKASFLGDLDRIKYFSVKTLEGLPLYLNQVAEVKEVQHVGAVNHRDRRRIGYVEGDLLKTDMAEVSQRLRQFLNENVGSEGENWLITGQEKDRVESQTALIFAIGLSLFVVFLIVASQFESLRQPIIVLIAVPLSFFGIGVFLWLFQLNISALVYVGIIILVGASVNTSIVMVDFANQLMAEGMDVKAAIIESTKKRMKPILVTTLCNLFGLVPMAFSFGQNGSAMQQPLAVAILGGLFSSTILTLFIVPLAFTYLSEKNRS